MKILMATVMALSLSASAFAGDLNSSALKTLLSTSGTSLVGDVHSYETLASIYQGAIDAKANIENDCEISKGSENADCILWLTFSPMGETALQYSVSPTGDKLVSKIINVSRGD